MATIPSLAECIETDFSIADKINPLVEEVPKIVAAGRGLSMSLPPIRDKVVELTGEDEPNILYLGTASFDNDAKFKAQTKAYDDVGCDIVKLDLCDDDTLIEEDGLRELIVNWADAVLCSGGNPSYAIMRWKELGVDMMMLEAAERGVVLCGGSAGAMCWFSEFRVPTKGVKPALEEEGNYDTDYVRMSGFGYVPTLVQPHYDKTQANGHSRRKGATLSLQDTPGIACIGLDENAALVIVGDNASAVSGDGKAKVYKKILINDEPMNIPIDPEEVITLTELASHPDCSDA